MSTFLFIIPGRPVILKNSKKIITVHGRPLVTSNANVDCYGKRARIELARQWRGQATVTGPVNLRVTAFLAAGHDSGNLPDLSNLYQMPEDLLQTAGIIENDRLIESHDGSRRICLCDGPCPRRPIITRGANKGERKENCGAVKSCPFERLELEISPAVIDALTRAEEYAPFGKDGAA